MVIRVVVWNWNVARRRNIILSIAQWIERLAIILAGIFKRLEAFIGNLGGHDVVLVDRLSTISSDLGVDHNRARLDARKQTRDEPEHMDVGCVIAGVVLSIPSSQRFSLDADSVMGIGFA